MQTVNIANNIGKFPSTLLEFIKTIIKGFSKNLSKNLIKALVVSGCVFLVNYVLVSIWGAGNIKEDSVLSSLMVKQGNLLQGSFLWAALSTCLLSVFQKVRSYGFSQVLMSTGSSIGLILNLKRNFKNIPFLIGGASVLLLSMLTGNVLLSITLFLSFLLSTAFYQKSSIIYIFRFIWSQIQKVIMKKQKDVSGMEKVLNLVQGCSLGFGLYSVSMLFKQGVLIQSVCIFIIVLMIVLARNKANR